VATVASTLQARTAWAVMTVTVVLLALSRALQWQLTVEFITASVGNALIILACAGVGFVIISRQPGNVIGWIYALVALVFAVGEFAGSYTSRPLPGRMWTALLPDLAWIAAIPLGARLLLVLYPTRSAALAALAAGGLGGRGGHGGRGSYLGTQARSDGLPARCRKPPWGWSRPNGYSTSSSWPPGW
jgi:hypothetical protein